jgi:hypothetical protein
MQIDTVGSGRMDVDMAFRLAMPRQGYGGHAVVTKVPQP